MNVTPAVLSVVIVRFAGGPTIEETLDSLVRQGELTNLEIVVAHRDGDGPTPALQQRFPTVRWCAAGTAAPPATLRAVGVRATSGSIVACTEDHCVPAPDWCRRIIAAHDGVSTAVGGAIDKAQSASGVAWAAYLLDYARYMSPLPAGPATYASDCNVSYPRAALDAVADVWREEFHETTVHWALAGRSVPLLLDPTVVVRQHRDVSLREYLAERRAHGRIFAVTRIAGATPLARASFALKALLLPPIMVQRVRRLLAERGGTAPVPPSTWRPLMRAAIAWSTGELQGYVTGR